MFPVFWSLPVFNVPGVLVFPVSRSLPVRFHERVCGLHLPPRLFTQLPVLTSHPCLIADKGEHHLLIKLVVRDHVLPLLQLPLPFFFCVKSRMERLRGSCLHPNLPITIILRMIVALWKCFDFMCVHTH